MQSSYTRLLLHHLNPHFTCKYSRKVGYLPCPLQYKITCMASSEEVQVEINCGWSDHIHKTDPDQHTEGLNFRWTEEMTTVVLQGVKNRLRPLVG